MKLRKCIDKENGIHLEWTDTDSAGDLAEMVKEIPQKPLPSFDKALNKLISVCAHVADFDPNWMTSTGMRCTGVSVFENKYSARSVKLHCRTTLKNGSVWNLVLPTVRLDAPGDGEANVPLGVTAKDAELIKSFIHEAEAYADGNRSQQTFLDKLDPEPSEEGDKLPLD